MDLIRHLRSTVKHAHEHIAFSRHASLWFFVIVVHCILQVSLQVVTFTDNATAQHVVDVCLQEAGMPKAFIIISGGTLQECNGIPYLASTTCQILSTVQNDLVHSYSERDSDQTTSLNLTLPNGTNMTTSSQCVISLSWLDEMFRDEKTEDIVTLCFHFWLFAVSLLAILNDSIPHLAVCVTSHFLDTAWACFRIKATMNLHADYNKYIVQGTCDGTDVLGNWWDVRLAHAIPIAASNAAVLAAILYLSWMLFWAFVRKTFSRVGGSPAINRAYKLVLFFEAEMELGAFFALASTAMWMDRISNGAFTKEVKLFQILFITIAVILPLWILSGWISIRKEIKWLFLFFALFQSAILSIWLASFVSAVYRYEIISSAFFSTMSTTSFVFFFLIAITGCTCRFNFDRGLAHFLKVQAVLGSADFTPGYFDDSPPTFVETEPDFNFTDPEKAKENRLDPETKTLDYPLNRGPSHNFRSTMKRLNNAARNVIHQKEGDHVDFAPYRISLLCEPQFKLPAQPTPAASLSGVYEPTISMVSQSSRGSAGVISYASRSPLPNATARTLNMPHSLKNTYLAP